MRKGLFDDLGSIILWILLFVFAAFGIYSLLKRTGVI